MHNAIQQMNMGGNDITQYLKTLLEENNKISHTLVDQVLIQDMKDNLGFVSLHSKNVKGLESIFYECPNGAIVDINFERCQCFELFFEPTLLRDKDRETSSLPLSIYKAISKCDDDIQKKILEAIVLVGASSLAPGFAERLNVELQTILSSSPLTSTKDISSIKIVALKGRGFAAWIGGSILASLASFQEIWIKASTYRSKDDLSFIHDVCFF